jgi:hypothetical protein
MQTTPDEAITLEELRARAANAGLVIDSEHEDDIAFMLTNALAPLRTLDSRGLRLIEPAVAFDAVRGVQP